MTWRPSFAAVAERSPGENAATDAVAHKCHPCVPDGRVQLRVWQAEGQAVQLPAAEVVNNPKDNRNQHRERGGLVAVCVHILAACTLVELGGHTRSRMWRCVVLAALHARGEALQELRDPVHDPLEES